MYRMSSKNIRACCQKRTKQRRRFSNFYASVQWYCDKTAEIRIM